MYRWLIVAVLSAVVAKVKCGFVRKKSRAAFAKACLLNRQNECIDMNRISFSM